MVLWLEQLYEPTRRFGWRQFVRTSVLVDYNNRSLFLIREILIWYWKINKIVSLLEGIEENTRRSTSHTHPILKTPQSIQTPVKPAPQEVSQAVSGNNGPGMFSTWSLQKSIGVSLGLAGIITIFLGNPLIGLCILFVGGVLGLSGLIKERGLKEESQAMQWPRCYPTKCLLANANPEPCFRYFSNASAFVLVLNAA